MSAISPKANARMSRIRIVSRIVKYAILGLFLSSIGIFLLVAFPTWRLVTLKEHPVWSVFVDLPQVVLWVWYWKLARLFDFYERGLIFTNATIRCIKTLGILCVVNWLLFTFFNLWKRSVPLNHTHPPQPGVTMNSVKPVHVETLVETGFFNFSIAGISFGLLLAGIIITVIAWIMNEGRKIQEEQELTV